MASILGAVVSALVGLAGLFIGWRRARESALRREDVLVWSNEVIRSLQSLLLICTLKSPPLDEAVVQTKLTEVIFDTSILVERGRLFFRNEVKSDHGAEKQPANRGSRPEILDQIVVAYQIACAWGAADPEARARMHLIAEDVLKRFVSLAQMEVGRSRTASVDTSKGGKGAHLKHLMQNIDEDRLSRLRLKEV